MKSYSSKGSIDENKALVEYLKRNGTIKSKKVAEVKEKIDRGLFVPNGVHSYVDNPMQIGYNATISAPHMHATCLELLEEHLKPGMRALDVGSDGRLGWLELAPYDAIHVGAAVPVIPQALINQLKPCGRLVIPVGTHIQELQVIDKKDDGSTTTRNVLAVRYIPLTSKEAQLHD